MIADTIARLRRDAGIPVDPTRRGPVPLNRLFEEVCLSHVAIPTLSRGSVAEHLQANGNMVQDLGDPSEKLAGFLFAAGRFGLAFVNAQEILPRRRFTAAHELGHFVMHREQMGSFRADTDATLKEADGGVVDEMEREANQFAAELLMPVEVCEARAEELRRAHKCCPRGVLTYRLASEFLVSRQAMRYRLQSLDIGEVGDE